MNIVFAGTPAFAVPSLRALVDAGHDIRAVYTQPDRLAGRGRKMKPCAVKEFALQHGLPVRQPDDMRAEAGALRQLRPDIMVVVAYGQILSPEILALPIHGCVNVHASLLPRWRGAAPVARAIEAGDTVTGVTLMQMDAGLDTGDILQMVEIPITENDTAGTLHDRLAELGARALVTILEKMRRGEIIPQPQDPAHATYAPKLRKEEARLDWTQPAVRLQRKVHALIPWPVASTEWNGKALRLWECSASGMNAPAASAPGTVLSTGNGGIQIATGDGILNITRLQLEGGRPMTAAEFLNGHSLAPGARLR